MSERSSASLRLLTAPLDALWRWCTTPLLAVALAACAAAAVATGLALPQAPASVAGDAQALGRWLAELQLQRGAWVGAAGRAGLLSVYGTPAFRALWAAIGLAALVAVADRALAWRRLREGIPWQALAHLGLLLLLAGGLVEERWGQEQALGLVGEGRLVAAIGGLRIGLGPQTGAAGGVRVVWRRGGAEGEGELVPGRPLELGVVSLHLGRAGEAVRLRLSDATGRAVPLEDPALGGPLQAEATLRFGGEAGTQHLSAPARDLLIRVSRQPPAMGEAPFRLWVYHGQEATPLAEAKLGPEGGMQAGEGRLDWQVLPYAEVTAALHPGLGLWALGWLLICLGLAATLGRSLRQRGLHGARWIWVPAAAGLGGLIWLLAGGCRVAAEGSLGAAAGLALALGAGMAVLGAATGMAALSRRRAGPACDSAVGWGLLAWAVGGGLAVAARWLAHGALWSWGPWQAWWGLGACLLVAAWHARSFRRRGARLGALALAAAVAVAAVMGGAMP